MFNAGVFFNVKKWINSLSLGSFSIMFARELSIALEKEKILSSSKPTSFYIIAVLMDWKDRDLIGLKWIDETTGFIINNII